MTLQAFYPRSNTKTINIPVFHSKTQNKQMTFSSSDDLVYYQILGRLFSDSLHTLLHNLCQDLIV